MRIPSQITSKMVHFRHFDPKQMRGASSRLLGELFDNADHFNLGTILVVAFVWAMSDMSSLTISAYFPSYAIQHGATGSQVGLMFALTAVVELMFMPLAPKVMSCVGNPMAVLRVASFAMAGINLMWAFAYKFEAQFVTLCFVLRGVLGVVMSFVEVASSSIGLRSAGPERVGEALAYIFVIRAAGMLVGPILGGVLFQFGGYPAPGLVIAVLIVLVALLTLCPTKLVEHDHAKKSEIGIWEILKTPGICACLALITAPMIAFSFLGPCLQSHVEGAPFLLNSSGVGLVFSCSTVTYLLSNAVIAPLAKRFGESTTGLGCTFLLGTMFLMLGPAAFLTFVPLRTDVLCVLMLFLGFSVGGITVPLETLMTKLVLMCPREKPLEVSQFSDSLAAVSGFAATFGAIVGPVMGGVLVQSISFSASTTALGYFVLCTGIFSGVFIWEAQQIVKRVEKRDLAKLVIAC